MHTNMPCPYDRSRPRRDAQLPCLAAFHSTSLVFRRMFWLVVNLRQFKAIEKVLAPSRSAGSSVTFQFLLFEVKRRRHRIVVRERTVSLFLNFFCSLTLHATYAIPESCASRISCLLTATPCA